MTDTTDAELVSTSIRAVTVYTNQALVTRRGVFALTGQMQDIAIAGLPISIQPESIRASGTAAIAVQLLGVRTERTFATEPVEERVAQLTQQIEELEAQKQSYDIELTSLHLQLNFVQGLQEKSINRFAIALPSQQVSLAQTGEFLNFLGHRYSDYAVAIATLERQKRELEKQLQALSQKLRILQSPHTKESYTIIVSVVASAPSEFNLDLSYVVNYANWHPMYDLRVSDAGVNLTYLAEVQQRSGEDWIDAKLTLSTAKPGLGTLPPQLPPWYVDVYQPPAAAKAMSTMMMAAPMARRREETSSVADEFSDLGSMSEAVTVAAEVKSEGGVVTFAIDRNGNIPSDGTPQKITIFNDDYPSHVSYIAIPKLVSFAYLQAVVTNPSDGVTLLPGRANIFRDNMFVGTTQLENIAPGQEFKLNLGIDESIKIERNLVEREVDKRFISGQRRTTYAYRLFVTNLNSDRTVNLKLTEQLPTSRNEQIKIRLTRSSPQIQIGEMGLMEWSLALAPQVKQEIYYQFTVEHPPDQTITGLDV
jgi:uncharacterized protein (TIGR02231 family)